METVRITIEGAGGTFDYITIATYIMLKELGADVELISGKTMYDGLKEHELLTITDEQVKMQITNRHIEIKTKEHPWGG